MDFDIGKFRALADKKRLKKKAILRQQHEEKERMLTENGEWFVDTVFNAVLNHLNTQHEYSGQTSVDPEKRDFRDWNALTELVKARFVALGFEVLNLKVEASKYEMYIHINYAFK